MIMPRSLWGFLFTSNDMNHYHTLDTIVACSSGTSQSAIAVIRVSGDQAIEAVASHFSRPEKIRLADARFMLQGSFLDQQGTILDNVLVVKFPRPHSYTGDDLVEISCHGSSFIVEQIIRTLVQFGCRPAEAGEFTQRAFINGKIDLVQAEAVADMIAANTQRNQAQALAQLQGQLSQKVHCLRDHLLQKLSLLELELDFHEDEEFVDRIQFTEQLVTLQKSIEPLLHSFEYGRVIREGAHVVIIGKPNVGKSSLLNFLLKTDRAIVSEIPGTTRDTLEESLNLDGFLIKITDTAGLRDTADEIEKEGVARSINVMQKADLLLMVVDASQPLTQEDLSALQQSRAMNKQTILAFNKMDRGLIIPDLVWPPCRVPISCKTGQGMSSLKEALVEMIFQNRQARPEIFIDKIRHWSSLNTAHEHIDLALQSLYKKLSAEFISVDLRAALDAMGQITGQVTREDVLNNIFAKFCIGK